MYVRVQVNNGIDPEAILIAQRAVQRNVDGSAYVIVVDNEDTAEHRAVQTGTMHGADWHILEGLAAGERVIINGAINAQPGEKVRVTSVIDDLNTPLSVAL